VKQEAFHGFFPQAPPESGKIRKFGSLHSKHGETLPNYFRLLDGFF
jgi:hypothetical protein